MKRIKILLFTIPLFLIATGYLLIKNDNLAKIIVKAVVKYENLRQETPQTFEVMDSWYFDEGMRSKYAILKSLAKVDILEKMTGVKVFASGPHTDDLNYNASSMGYYNPEFLEMTCSTMEELFKDEEFKEDAKVLYEKRFQNMLRAYYMTYKEMDASKIAQLKIEYLGYLEQDNLPESYALNTFYDHSNRLQMDKYQQYELAEILTAMGFWLRRSIDGTDSQFMNILNLVFENLDPDFYKITQLSDKLNRIWTNGDESFGMEFFNESTIAFGGGGIHERMPGFSISVNDNVQLFEYDGQRAMVLRTAKNEIKAWYKEMNPSEGLYKTVLLNMTNHQLAGKYVRNDNGKTVSFFPNRFVVKGLSKEESYQFAVDGIEFPMDLIYFSNGEGFGYEKTSTGLNLYKASSNGEFWNLSEEITASLKKIDGVAPEYSRDLPGKYPFASSEILTIGALRYYSKSELRIMRNEIFARYGYAFNSAGMKEYFGKESWYQRGSSDVTGKLTPLERLNIEFIQFYEKIEEQR